LSDKPFLHERDDFVELILIVSDRLERPQALVEKDYWVTHTLWSLQKQGFTVLFKGGTSLSKGYDVIERFSEDLDIKLESEQLPSVDWKRETKTHRRKRAKYFDTLKEQLSVPGAEVSEIDELRERKARSATFAVHYPGKFTERLPETLRPFVQIEIGSARVNPGTMRRISSWIHDFVWDNNPELAEQHVDNRPEIHCVYPRVTLLEKIEAIARAFDRKNKAATAFARHYEDAYRIILSEDLQSSELNELLAEMKETGDITNWPPSSHEAFQPGDSERWQELEKSWEAIGSMFWGERHALVKCSDAIVKLLVALEDQ
jgi:hypothetical protein